MSDKIYACLLRLFPSAFRTRYQEEALQLYRDRLRDESGVFHRSRLYCDLLVDVLVSLPQAWRDSYAAANAPSLVANADRVPSFRMLDNEPLPPASILIASALSFAALSIFGLMLNFPTLSRSSSTSNQPSPVESVMERLNRAIPPGNDDQMTTRNASAAGQGQFQTGDAAAILFDSGTRLDHAERDRVIRTVASILVAHYVDPQKARVASDLLLAAEKHGEYEAISNRTTLAERLTADVQSATQDPHLAVQYSRSAIPNSPPTPTAAQREEYRAAMLRQNCMVEKVQVLPNKIGYIKLNFLPDPPVCGAIIYSAMEQLDQSHVIIFDLRDNTGGFPDMVADLAAELFDHPVLWYNPRQTPSASMLSPAPGSKLATKPAYILTSSRTFSGAEHFTYNLKMLKRATVIGETTRGGHVGTIHRIDDHFWMAVPEVRKPSPYGTLDWTGTGVEPDVKVKAAYALDTAEKLAESKLQRK